MKKFTSILFLLFLFVGFSNAKKAQALTCTQMTTDMYQTINRDLFEKCMSLTTPYPKIFHHPALYCGCATNIVITKLHKLDPSCLEEVNIKEVDVNHQEGKFCYDRSSK